MDFAGFDCVFEGLDKCFPGLGTVTSEGIPIPETAVEPTFFPSTSSDAMDFFNSISLRILLDTGSTLEVTDDLSFVPRGILSTNSPPQIALPVNEWNFSVAPTSTSPSLPPTQPPAQATAFDPPKWRKIPQTVYFQGKKHWDFKQAESIVFEVENYPGIKMADAFRDWFTGLKDRDDFVLQDGRKAFSCRLSFPGYPPNKSPQIFTRLWDKERKPLVRSKLAYHVAKKLKQYLDSMNGLHTMGGGPANNEWVIGQGFMLFENMYLAKIVSVSKGSFQPEIWVMDPSV